MAYHADFKAARLAAEKTLNAAPTQANVRQHANLNLLEIRVADLKAAVVNINAAGGVIDPTASAALTNLFSVL